MDNETRQRFERIERQMGEAHARIDQRPLWPIAPSQNEFIIVQVVGGNALPVTGEPGIRRALALPADIPVYDLSGSPTCVDGIGYGLNEDADQLVLMHNAPPSQLHFDLWVGQRVMCKRITLIPITGADPVTYAQVWSPWFIVG